MRSDPRSWTANFEQVLDHLGVAVLARGDDASIQLLDRRLVVPAEALASAARRSSRRPRTAPAGWRCTIVASNSSASTTRSRSEPAGRSNTIHSSAPSLRRSKPAREPVGEAAGDRERASVHRVRA